MLFQMSIDHILCFFLFIYRFYAELNVLFYYTICMQVRWKGYGPNDDTWEPIEGLGYANFILTMTRFTHMNSSTLKMQELQ
jgi:hypothetical protein